MEIKHYTRTYQFEESEFHLQEEGTPKELSEILAENFKLAREYLIQQVLDAESTIKDGKNITTEYSLRLKRIKPVQKLVDGVIYWWIEKNRTRITPYIVVTQTSMFIKDLEDETL